MTVTGDETLAQHLRETQAKLQTAEAEIASLKVLLALRTHQHDQAWQAARRAAMERDRAQAGASFVAAAPESDRMRAGDAGLADAAHAEALARAEARTDAVRVVLGAVLASLRVWALNRRRFQALIAQAGREAPQAGPGAERHAVLLAEARRVLGRTG